jgi:hypothetical protein
MMPRFFRKTRKPAVVIRPGFRPSLDRLEDRSLLNVGGTASLPLAHAPPAGPPLPDAANFAPSRAVTTAPDIPVTVLVNAASQTFDLNALVAKTGGVDPTLAPGLRFSIVGNSNPDLVTARLADDDLVLTFAPGQTGTAKVSVNVTDGAGASVLLTFVVTVGAGGA